MERTAFSKDSYAIMYVFGVCFLNLFSRLIVTGLNEEEWLKASSKNTFDLCNSRIEGKSIHSH